jgi:hypothetical protein
MPNLVIRLLSHRIYSPLQGSRQVTHLDWLPYFLDLFAYSYSCYYSRMDMVAWGYTGHTGIRYYPRTIQIAQSFPCLRSGGAD